MEGDRVFLSADDRAVVRKAIAQLERVRGLPLTLPEHTEFDEAAAALRDIVARAEAKRMSTEDVAHALEVYLAGRAARPTRGTARKKTSANSRTP